jgi:hypothetical protein
MCGGQRSFAAGAQLVLAPASEPFVAASLPANERYAEQRHDQADRHPHHGARVAHQQEGLTRHQGQSQPRADHAADRIVLRGASAERLRAHGQDLEHDSHLERGGHVVPDQTENGRGDERLRKHRLRHRRGVERGDSTQRQRDPEARLHVRATAVGSSEKATCHGRPGSSDTSKLQTSSSP